MSRELFGTDGVRGLAGQYPLDGAGAKSIAMAVGTHFAEPGQQIVIARDPRESSTQLESDLINGLTAVGVNVVSVGVIPTPGLAFITRENDKFVAGVMVTASHNPYEYNGVKVFDSGGGKLSDDTEVIINKFISEGVPERPAGSVTRNEQLIQSYADFLVDSAGGLQLSGLRLAVDSANGAASGIAGQVLSKLGAEVTSLFDKPDGRNINNGCGATHIEALQKEVTERRLAIGIALDGDADRVIMVDDKGREVKGDYMLYILAVANKLDGVVTTVMSNLGFEKALTKQGISLERTKVGDRYVLEGLKRTGFKLGGEQSGHIIFPDILATGDGLLAAVHTIRAIQTSGKSLAEWCDEVEVIPQALVNMPLADKSLLENQDVLAYIKAQTAQLAGKGRLLIRPSGTEPLARVMVEGENAQQVAEKITSELQVLLEHQS